MFGVDIKLIADICEVGFCSSESGMLSFIQNSDNDF